MPKRKPSLEELKAEYIARCEATLSAHHRHQELQRQIAKMRDMHRQLSREKGQKDNASALAAQIAQAEADALALDMERVRCSATAETIKADMWAAVRRIDPSWAA